VSASGLVYIRRLVALSYASLASFCTTTLTLLYPQTIPLSLLLLSAMKVFSANFSRLCLYLSASLVVSGAVAKPARILKRSSVARRSVTSAGRPLTQFNIRENRSGLSRIRRQGPSPAFNAVVPEATGTTPDSGGNDFVLRPVLPVFGAVVSQGESGSNTSSVSANTEALNTDGTNLAGGSADANGIKSISGLSAAPPLSDLAAAAASSTSNGVSENVSVGGVPNPQPAGGLAEPLHVVVHDGSPGSYLDHTSISGIGHSVAGLGRLQSATPVTVDAGELTVTGNSPATVASAAGTDVLTASDNNPGANLASVLSGIVTATIPSGAAMPNGVAAFVNTPGAEMGVEPSVNGSTPSAVAASVPPAGGNNLGPDLATVPGNVTPAATTLSGHGAASVDTAGAGTGNPTANGDIGNVMVPPANTGSGAGIPNPNANGDFVSATVSGAPIAVPSVNGNPNSANADSQPASGAPINVFSGDPNFDLVSIDASGSPAVNADTPSASLSGTGNGPAFNGGTPSASSSASGNGLAAGGSNTSATANAQGSEPSFLTAPDADIALTTSTLGTTGGATTDTDDAVTATEELGMNAANVADDGVDIAAQDDTAHMGVGSNKVGEVVE